MSGAASRGALPDPLWNGVRGGEYQGAAHGVLRVARYVAGAEPAGYCAGFTLIYRASSRRADSRVGDWAGSMAGPRADAGMRSGAGGAAYFGLEPELAHSDAAGGGRTGLPDSHVQPDDRAAGSIVPADEAVLRRRFARATHADHGDSRPAGSGAVYGEDDGALPRSDVQRAAGYRPAFADCARAAAALAGGIGATGAAEIAPEPVRGAGGSGGAVPDSGGGGGGPADSRVAGATVSRRWTGCRSSA